MFSSFFLAINPSFLSPVVKDKSGDDTYDYLILIVGIQSYSILRSKSRYVRTYFRVPNKGTVSNNRAGLFVENLKKYTGSNE